jgi:hypothetical protein
MIDYPWLRRIVSGALRLQDDAFEEMVVTADGVARGIQLIVVIALIVGLVNGLAYFVRGVTTDPAQQVAKIRASVTQTLDQMSASGAFGGDEQTAEAVVSGIGAGFDIAANVIRTVQETTRAPRAAVTFFQAVGAWLSYPFRWLVLWIGWGALTLVFARLLGGRATIQQQLAASSLAAGPRLLQAVAWVPCVGPLIGLVALVWGIAVYTKAIAQANRLSVGTALVAVLAPAVLGLLVAVTASVLALGLLVAAAS